MTRLYYEIIKDIPDSLAELDDSLVCSTGCNLFELAARAAGIDAETAGREIGNYAAAVVPITSGQGIIQGFTESVNAILWHIGVETQITREMDVGGIGEVFKSGADIFFAADDRKFLAVNLNSSVVVDNSRATADGFVQALAAVAETRGTGLSGQKVLVIGLGPVGSHSAAQLERLNAEVLVFDSDAEKLKRFIELKKGMIPVSAISEAMEEADYVLDATPAPDIISEQMIRQTTVVSCPGVPHGLTRRALLKAGTRFIHDNLPMGVAVMALQSIFKSWD